MVITRGSPQAESGFRPNRRLLEERPGVLRVVGTQESSRERPRRHLSPANRPGRRQRVAPKASWVLPPPFHPEAATGLFGQSRPNVTEASIGAV